MARIQSPSRANSRAYAAAHLARAAACRLTLMRLGRTTSGEMKELHAKAIHAAKGERAYWKAGYRLP